MKKTLINVAVIAAIAAGLYVGGCSYSNIPDIKAHAAQTWDRAGFRIVGYEGYEIGAAFETPGGEVWYIVERKETPRVLYHGFVSKWGDEYHIYSLKAIDAIGSK